MERKIPSPEEAQHICNFKSDRKRKNVPRGTILLLSVVRERIPGWIDQYKYFETIKDGRIEANADRQGKGGELS